MRPDYCPVAKEPCQAMCDPKCRLRKPPTDRELAAAYTNAQSQAPKHIGHIHGLRAVDVTSDVLRSVVEKAEYHGGSFEIQAGDAKWAVTVTKEQT